MPDSLVSVADLKAILGIGNLYPDATLEQIGQAATDVILAYLVQNREVVTTSCCTESVPAPGTGTIIRFRVTKPTRFIVDQTIKFGLVASTDLSGRTLTVIEIEDDGFVLQAQSGTPFNPGTSDPRLIIPNAFVYDADSINFYEDVPEVLEAVTAVAVDMFQSRIAPGGQIEAVDFTPGPYRMGRSLLTRVSGLLGRWMDVGSLVG